MLVCHACYCLECVRSDSLGMNWSVTICSDAESEVCEHDLVKVAVRGHVGVHGGLSHCSRPQELSSVFVIHEQLLPHIGFR